MSTTFRKTGKIASLIATGDVASGSVVGPYGTGQRFAIAITDAKVGEQYSAEVCGVHDLPAITTGAWANGDTLYWNGTALTDSASDNQEIGIADAPKVGGETGARVLLNGLPK